MVNCESGRFIRPRYLQPLQWTRHWPHVVGDRYHGPVPDWM